MPSELRSAIQWPQKRDDLFSVKTFFFFFAGLWLDSRLGKSIRLRLRWQYQLQHILDSANRPFASPTAPWAWRYNYNQRVATVISVAHETVIPKSTIMERLASKLILSPSQHAIHAECVRRDNFWRRLKNETCFAQRHFCLLPIPSCIGGAAGRKSSLVKML